MASPQGTSLKFDKNILTYRSDNNLKDSQHAHIARAIRRSPVIRWERDKPVKHLTSQIAHILYYRDRSEDEDIKFRCSELHRHPEVSPLLAQYEPGSCIDPQQLKVTLEHLKPLIKTGESTIVGLYNFIKQFLILRKSWLKAAAEFYGMLAYLDMLEKRGLQGSSGPSFPGHYGPKLIQLEFQREREELETHFTALLNFKMSTSFTSNMRNLFAYFEKMKVDEECRQKQNQEAMKQAAEGEKKRAAIKERNENVILRQMGPVIDVEMGDELQQHILDMMMDTMQFELGVDGKRE